MELGNGSGSFQCLRVDECRRVFARLVGLALMAWGRAGSGNSLGRDAKIFRNRDLCLCHQLSGSRRDRLRCNRLDPLGSSAGHSNSREGPSGDDICRRSGRSLGLGRRRGYTHSYRWCYCASNLCTNGKIKIWSSSAISTEVV